MRMPELKLLLCTKPCWIASVASRQPVVQVVPSRSGRGVTEAGTYGFGLNRAFARCTADGEWGISFA